MRPTIIPKYNGSMGGTDTNDQLGQTYRPRLKTASWIPRVFSHFLNHAVVNMFVIVLSIRNRMEQYEHVIKILPRRHLHFRLTLVDALTKSYLQQRILKEAPVNQQSMNKKQWEAKLIFPGLLVHITQLICTLMITRGLRVRRDQE